MADVAGFGITFEINKMHHTCGGHDDLRLDARLGKRFNLHLRVHGGSKEQPKGKNGFHG